MAGLALTACGAGCDVHHVIHWQVVHLPTGAPGTHPALGYRIGNAASQSLSQPPSASPSTPQDLPRLLRHKALFTNVFQHVVDS